jgi:hypothetical protein
MTNNNMDATALMASQTPRLYIFVGAYGSGKSEVSVHFARKLRKENPDRKILLADLDIVNPFYRSSDARSVLEKEQIRVIAPNFANTNVDVPSVSGEMYAIFDDPDYLGVFDIGGEDLGARILSSMHSRFKSISYCVYMVINTLRPFTSDEKSIAKMTQELSQAARLPISGLIDNTNLLSDTSIHELVDSYPIVSGASRLTGIPFVFASGLDTNLPADWDGYTKDGVPLLRMQRTVLYNEQDPYEAGSIT